MGIAKVILNGSTLIDLTDDTVEASKLLSGYTATAADGVGVIGNIATKSSADVAVSGPTVSVASGYYSSDVSIVIDNATFQSRIDITGIPYVAVDNNGLINVSYQVGKQTNPIITSGYADSSSRLWFIAAGSTTYQLDTIAAATITPTTTNQTIPSGKYLTGVQTIKGDANLVAANIASGVSIFGVVGTHQGGIDVDDIIIIGDYGACFSNFGISGNTCISSAGTISGNTLIAI